jgi:oligoendopeptidase F
MDKKFLEALVREVLDEISSTGTGASVTPGTGEGVATKYAFGKRKNKGTPSDWKEAPSIPNRASKAITYKELWEKDLNENYAKFRNETKTRNKPEQFHQAIKAVKKRVQEINRLFEYVDRLKNELNEDEHGLKYKKHTENALSQIKEMVSQLNNKVKKFK